MSTNSTINIKHKDGSFEGIYCHWDGYLSWNGQLLYAFYNTPEKVQELISLGSLSTLGMNIGVELPKDTEKEDLRDERERLRKDNFQCLFYTRDCGQEIECYKGEDEKHYDLNMQPYNYLFDENDGNWYVIEDGEKSFLIDALRTDWRENGYYFEPADKSGSKTIGEICTPEQLERLAVLKEELQKPVVNHKKKEEVR